MIIRGTDRRKAVALTCGNDLSISVRRGGVVVRIHPSLSPAALRVTKRLLNAHAASTLDSELRASAHAETRGAPVQRLV